MIHHIIATRSWAMNTWLELIINQVKMIWDQIWVHPWVMLIYFQN